MYTNSFISTVDFKRLKGQVLTAWDYTYPDLKQKYSGIEECKRVCVLQPGCRSINIYTTGTHKNLCSFFNVSGEHEYTELREHSEIDHYYIPEGDDFQGESVTISVLKTSAFSAR